MKPVLPATGVEGKVFDLYKIANRFPATAETMLLDVRLTDEAEASSRVFRVYRPAPAHYHATCDEYLVVLSGRALFFMGDGPSFEVGVGAMIFFKKNTVHGMPQVLEEPFVVLAVDTPRRDPTDVIFVNPEDGDAASFIASRALV